MGNQRLGLGAAIASLVAGCGRVESEATDAPTAIDASTDAPTAIDASIDAPDPVQLHVNPTGPGTVALTPPGISCGTGCTTHERNTTVLITPQPNAGAVVNSWSGVCASTAAGSPCSVTLSSDSTAIDVNFIQLSPMTFDFTGAAQSYTVPAGATRLGISADGASGGDAINVGSTVTYFGGHGAHVDTVVDVSAGQVLTIIVGQRPDPNPPGSDGCGASGGGASMVALGANVLAVAGGGGGGAAFSSYSINGGDAQAGPNGAGSGTLAGGTGGLGGAGSPFEGGGGAGIMTDGTVGEATGGQALLNGAAGGRRAESEACGNVNGGGFGGGGGGGNDLSGGGGGYSGGAAQSNENPGTGITSGGGGSFGMGTPTITVRTDQGHGRVTLTPM